MALKSSNKVETNRYELVVEIDGETFMKAVDAVYKRQVKSINIPGFRKGKAPRRLIEKEYGEGVFYEDAIKNLYPAAIVAAADEAGLNMIRDQIEKGTFSNIKDFLTDLNMYTKNNRNCCHKILKRLVLSGYITEDDRKSFLIRREEK